MKMERFSAILLILTLLPMPVNGLSNLTFSDLFKSASRQCIQCVDGNFLKAEWLMVSPSEGQEIEWKEAWESTNCSHQNFHTIYNCMNACVTILLERMTDEGWIYEGVLKDCSDGLILSSPDIPEGAGKTNLGLGDGVYIAKRHHYQIRYNFTLNADKTDSADADFLLTFLRNLPHLEKITTTTYYWFIAVASSIFFCVIVMCCICIVCWIRRIKNKKTVKEEEFNMAILETNNSEINQAEVQKTIEHSAA